MSTAPIDPTDSPCARPCAQVLELARADAERERQRRVEKKRGARREAERDRQFGALMVTWGENARHLDETVKRIDAALDRIERMCALIVDQRTAQDAAIAELQRTQRRHAARLAALEERLDLPIGGGPSE